MPESSSTSSVVQAIEAMAPPEYVDRESMVVTRFQARAALLNAGLLDTVNTAMQSAQPVAQLAWADAQTFRRLSPTVMAIGAGLGLSDEQLDDLFIYAAKIEA